MTHHLVGITEIAAMLGVSRQRANQVSRAYADFPEPEAELSAGRVWKRKAIESWMRAHPVRKPGRPPSKRPKRGS
ncbi:MAG: DNA-binding protein [Acidimicrobiia bacterium]